MAAIECKLAMCISRLVEFELLLELKIEQKNGTSLVKLVLSRRMVHRLEDGTIFYDVCIEYPNAWYYIDIWKHLGAICNGTQQELKRTLIGL
jgi:hypothetical protein